MYLPSLYPTLEPPTGPLNGIPEIDKAADTPSIAIISGSTLLFAETTLIMTCTSFIKPSGNRGLIGLSISLEVNVSFSLGRPSLFRKPPGILPAEYVFSI